MNEKALLSPIDQFMKKIEKYILRGAASDYEYEYYNIVYGEVKKLFSLLDKKEKEIEKLKDDIKFLEKDSNYLNDELKRVEQDRDYWANEFKYRKMEGE